MAATESTEIVASSSMDSIGLPELEAMSHGASARAACLQEHHPIPHAAIAARAGISLSSGSQPTKG